VTELEQLRADLATVNAAREIYDRDYKGCDYEAMIGIMQKCIAKLEAEADPWAAPKRTLDRIEMKEQPLTYEDMTHDKLAKIEKDIVSSELG
jgi:hypothetical protein